MKKCLFIMLICITLTKITVCAEKIISGVHDSSGVQPKSILETGKDTNQKDILNRLSLEEKVAQLFFITPEALTGVDQVTVAGSTTKQCFSDYPVGGIIYFEQNIQSRDQVSEMLADMQSISIDRLGLPVFLAVDEEGGSVTRISGSSVENIPYISDMLSVGLTGDASNAYWVGQQIGTYLSELKFNLDFAPVADVFSNPNNTVIGDRAFGYDSETVAQMVQAFTKGMLCTGVQPTLKHFPGHGDTEEDSHYRFAYSYKNLDQLRNSEFIPFKAGIENGANFVMVGHISLPNVMENDVPASLSYFMVTKVLREELGFQKIVITDALNMGAIANSYLPGEAAVQAILAGVDMLLMPSDFYDAYDSVLNAVHNGIITESRLNESVERIIEVKQMYYT